MSRAKKIAKLLGFGALALFLGGSSLMSQEEMNAQQFNYNTITVSQGDLRLDASVGANIYYNRSVPVLYHGDGAHFVEYLTEEDVIVAQGDTFARLTIDGSRVDVTDLEYQLINLQSEHALGLVQLQEELDALLEVYAELDEDDDEEFIIAGLQVERKRLEMEQYDYQMTYEEQLLQAQIDRTNAVFADTDILVPIDGVVRDVANSIRSGDYVAGGTQLGIVYDDTSYILRVADESGQFRYNARVTVTYGPSENRRTVTGRVVSSNNIMPEGVDSFSMSYIQLDEPVPAEEMKTPSITMEKVNISGSIVVTRRAIRQENGENYVLILDGDTVRKRFVVLGAYTASEAVILQGLEEGQQLILN